MRAVVVTKTADMPREEWLRWRRWGIGSSDAAAIAGLDPHRTPMGVYLDKTGELPDEEPSEAAYWGNALEAVVAREFALRTGHKVRRLRVLLRHPKHIWMLANIDRFVVGGGILECKVSGERHLKEWQDGAVPERVLVQVQHQLAVTGESKAWVAVLIGGRKFEIREVERDDDLIADLIRLEHDFWHNHVLTGNPPEPDGSQAATELLHRLYPESTSEKTAVLPVDEAEALIRQYLDAAAAIRDLKRVKAEAENRLKALMQDAEIGAVAGRPRVRWATVRATRLDARALKAAHPEIAQEFTVEQVYRRFAVLDEEAE